MHKLLKMIPTTGDMVSLWLPSGQNRAIDIIRGNDGQCYGTHPNVPVLPNLIDPSLGWHFDGADDYIDCGNDGSIYKAVKSGSFSIGFWVKTLEVLGTNSRIVWSIWKDANNYGGFYYPVTAGTKAIVNAETNDVLFSSGSIIATVDTDWHFIVNTFEGTAWKHYVDSSLVLSEPKGDLADFVGTPTFYIGTRRIVHYWFKGYIALPFIANLAWSVAKVNNFYLATKGLFSPRG